MKTNVVNTKNPKDIVNFFNKHIVNQSGAKRALSVAVFKHLLRMEHPELDLEKSNILMVGPSGCGKTHFAKIISKFLNIPFAIADATSLTEAGYVGDDVETVIGRLYQASGEDIEATEHGIIFIDEIDKKAKKGAGVSVTRDVSGEGVQQGLLKIIEGHTVHINGEASGRKHPGSRTIEIDTSNILFIVSGAFVGITKTDGRVTQYDLQKFGMIPELVGRLPVIAEITALGIDELKDILTKPENSIVSQYTRLFSALNCDLIFSEGALGKVAEKALTLGTGARALRSIIEEVILTPTFELCEHPNHVCTINEDFSCQWVLKANTDPAPTKQSRKKQKQAS